MQVGYSWILEGWTTRTYTSWVDIKSKSHLSLCGIRWPKTGPMGATFGSTCRLVKFRPDEYLIHINTASAIIKRTGLLLTICGTCHRNLCFKGSENIITKLRKFENFDTFQRSRMSGVTSIVTVKPFWGMDKKLHHKKLRTIAHPNHNSCGTAV